MAAAGDYQGALSLANDLVTRYPHEMKAWSLLGYVHAHNRDYTAAIANLTHAISINSMEPSLFFDRGRYRLRLGNDQSALSDFSNGIRLCDLYNTDYYREVLLFMRAEALVRLGRRDEALTDLAHVHENFTIWTDRLRTKSALLADCLNLPG